MIQLGFARAACALLVLAVAMSGWAAAAPTNSPSVDFQRILRERIDVHSNGVGIVIGLIDPQGTRVFSQGKMKLGETREVNGDTLFEIGSITKVFTSLLLQEMADEGELALDDPVKKFLPPGVTVPAYHGRQITLVDLATHTSGLPRLPFGLWHILTHLKDPYATFKEKDLYKFLSGYKLKREIGSTFEYSNVGLMLLGQALALKAGTNYEALVKERICRPLQMDSTGITLSPQLKARFATPHADGEPTCTWTQPLPADGGLRSSVNDMLKFLSAEMGLTPTRLGGAMSRTQKERRDTDDESQKVGLGWMIEVHRNTNNNVVWHDGATSGFNSWIGFNGHSRRGVVVLSNSDRDVDDLGEMLLGILEGHRGYREPVNVDPALYQRYRGRYECKTQSDGTEVFFITAKRGHIYSRLQSQEAFEIYPESECRFFNNELNTVYTFEKDAGGAVTNMVFTQDGETSQFARVR